MISGGEAGGGHIEQCLSLDGINCAAGDIEVAGKSEIITTAEVEEFAAAEEDEDAVNLLERFSEAEGFHVGEKNNSLASMPVSITGLAVKIVELLFTIWLALAASIQIGQKRDSKNT